MNNPESTQSWKTLYRVAGTAAAGVVLVMLAEILISFVPAGATLPETVIGWFDLLQSRPFIGLRNLGLINIISILLGVPVALALYVLLRRTDRAIAALALATSLLGAAVFLATNRAFPMLALSRRYAVAATGIERADLVAAGQALLAVGASHTPGTFLGFLLGSVAGITNAALMVRSGEPGESYWYFLTLAFLAWSSIPFLALGAAAWLFTWGLPGAVTLFVTAAVITLGGIQILVDVLLVNIDPQSGIVFVVLPVYQSVVAVLGIGLALASERLGRRLFPAARR